MNIPKDTILMLSGVSCVGKTTAAYEIIKNYPEFRRVSELDILRTVVRTAYEHFATEEHWEKEKILKKYDVLFDSLTNSGFETAKLQSKQLLPYVKEIILRQQRRRIPTILEGAAIIPSTYFTNNQPLEWLTNHVIFVNLFLSNESEHIARRQSRSTDRDYSESIDEATKIIGNARADKHELLHMETTNLSQQFDNVFSLDVSSSSPMCVANVIMELVYHYFDNNLHA